MGNPAARKSIFKKLKIRYNEDMDRTTLTDFFEEVETTEEYNGYFCSIAETISIVVLGSLCGLKNVSQIHQWAESERVLKADRNRSACLQAVPHGSALRW